MSHINHARSEFDFILGITCNLGRDIDEMEAGLTKAQRTIPMERRLAQLRERVAILNTCATDGLGHLKLLEESQSSNNKGGETNG